MSNAVDIEAEHEAPTTSIEAKLEALARMIYRHDAELQHTRPSEGYWEECGAEDLHALMLAFGWIERDEVGDWRDTDRHPFEV